MNPLVARLLVLLFSLSLSAPALAAPTTIRLAVAAGLAPVLQDLVSTYQTDHPDQIIQPNLASSGTLAKQIMAGAPTDIFIAANPQWMEYLDQHNLVVHHTITTFTRNTLVCAGPGNIKGVDFDSLINLNKIALGNPASSPVGEYARQALRAKKLYQPLMQQRKIVFSKTVRQAVLYAEQQLVDACFIYATAAEYSDKVTVFFEVPQKLYPPISFPLAITQSGKNKAAAQQFYQFLLSDQARSLLQKHGFKE